MGSPEDQCLMTRLLQKGRGEGICDPLDAAEVAALRVALETRGEDGALLAQLLEACNGLRAWEGALVIRPWRSEAGGMHDMLSWNEGALWRDHYPVPIASGVLCFGADVFGDQFALVPDGVARVIAETEEIVPMASSLREWVEVICADADVEVGAGLAASWSTAHAELPADHRLIARLPFVLGGEYELANLKSVPDLEGMLICAGIAQAVHGVPDGTSVVLRRGRPGD